MWRTGVLFAHSELAHVRVGVALFESDIQTLSATSIFVGKDTSTVLQSIKPHLPDFSLVVTR